MTMMATVLHETIGRPDAVKVGLKRRAKSYAGLRYRTLIDDSWRFTPEEYDRYQIDALRQIYTFARTGIPYYREQAASYPDLPKGATAATELLAGLPIVAKQTLRVRNSDFWPSPPLRFTTTHTTSGTSGTPMRIAGTIWERGFYQAVIDAWFRSITGKRWPRVLYLSGFVTPSQDATDIIWEDRVTKCAYLSIYALDRQHEPSIDRFIRSFQPDVIFGYASAIHELALVMGERPWKNQGIVVTTSEVLEPGWRQDIGATICRRVYDLYSSQESSFAAVECSAGALHLDPLLGIVELLDDRGQAVAAGDLGRVVVTGLYRKSMPLLRYDIGDSARSTGFATECSCGLRWPTIGAVEGRSEDLVRTRDGRRIGYLCFHATKNLDGIAEAQLIQRGYERFECSLVAPTADDATRASLEHAIRAEIVKRLFTDVDITFGYLDRIPRGPNGKFKAVVVAFADGEGEPVS